MKNGRFIKLLTAGKYQYPRILGYEVLTAPMTGEVDNCGIPCEILMQQEAFSLSLIHIFIPAVLNTEIYDEIIRVDNDAAIETAKKIAKKEGILVGISSGAAVFAAMELAKREEYAGKNIVVLLPDSGDRYYSTQLFQN